MDPGELVAESGAESAADPDLLFMAANAAFRAGQSRDVDLDVTLAALDRVVQAYADVLRAAPHYADASFNYEFVTRFRDTLARGLPVPGVPAEAAIVPSPDLPVGLTIHGRPGGPPPGTQGGQFRTVAPMSSEEREEADPGQGSRPGRRG